MRSAFLLSGLILQLFLAGAIAHPPAGSSPKNWTIRLFADARIESLVFTCLEGSICVRHHSKTGFDLPASRYVWVDAKGNELVFRQPNEPEVLSKELELIPLNQASVLRVKPVKPDLLGRKYSERIRIRARDGQLELLLESPTEPYIAGVVASETGTGWGLEFYKAQAVMCRTYAYGHASRHGDEGFDLCDGVHCQVYNGMCTNPEINRAVDLSAGLVIEDAKTGNLITGAFHANCGGQTARSADVWSADPHLVTVDDPWCRKTSQAKWNQKIPAEKWLQYLREKGFKLPDSLDSQQFVFFQPVRKAFYRIGKDSIALKKIRADWGLRSTFFELKPEGPDLILEGRGYGHGVGLCQEGAMEMARKGKRYDQIITFYFKGVKIWKRN